MAGKTITDVIGSDLEAFRKDENGKARTAEEIIQAAVAKGLKEIAPENRGSNTSDAALTNAILAQIKSNAQQNKGNTSISADVYRELGGKQSQGNFAKYLDPSQAKYQDKVGQLIKRPGDQYESMVLDRNQKTLSKEELTRIQNFGTTPQGTKNYGYIDPITGEDVYVNPFTGEIDFNRSNDPNAFMNEGSPSSKYSMARTNGIGGAGGNSFSTGSNMGGDPESLTAGDGRQFDNFSDYLTYQNNLDSKIEERKSAYDLLYAQFKQYGLESLVEPLKGLITSNTPPSEFVIKLRETEAYKKRFAGNAERIKKGLAAISEAEYIGLEDQYQNIMRNYGLPDKYWAKDAMGTQQGFTNFIGNDVSAAELEDRIMNAQNRVVNSNPEVSTALKQFYPEITNADILAYTLDPTKGLEDIKRKITAAEIGGAAIQSGLQTSLTRAEELRKYGINKETAQQGYGAIGSSLMRGSQLASMYGENPYTQTTAEQEVFKIPGAEEARRQRQKITGLEKATFSGQTGLTSGALARDRAGGY
jgi:hypothetical protein